MNNKIKIDWFIFFYSSHFLAWKQARKAIWMGRNVLFRMISSYFNSTARDLNIWIIRCACNKRKSHGRGFHQAGPACWERGISSFSWILVFSWNPPSEFHISKRLLLYPRLYNVNVSPLYFCSHYFIAKSYFSPYDAIFSPEPQVKFRQEGRIFLQPTTLTEWIILTSISDMFVSLCGKLHFMHCEKKKKNYIQISCEHLSWKNSWMQFCFMIHFPLFVNYRVFLFGAGTMVAKGLLFKCKR